MHYVGWDWASRSHDVTVIDDAGAIVDRWAFTHTEAGLRQQLHRLRRHGDARRATGDHRTSSGLVVDRLLGAGTRWCRCIRPRSTPLGHAGVPPGRSPTPATATSSLTTCAPTGIGCAGSSPPSRALRELQALVRLRDDQVRARTAAINQLDAPPWTRTGPAQRPVPLAGLADRAGLPDRLPDPRRPPPGSAKPAWRPSAGDTPTAAARPPPSSSTGCAPHPPLRCALPAGDPHRHDQRPGPAPAHPAQRPSANSTASSPTGSPPTRAAHCSARYPASARSTSPRSWPRSARSSTASTTRNRPPPSAAPRRSPRPPARPTGSTSGGRPTPGPARR